VVAEAVVLLEVVVQDLVVEVLEQHKVTQDQMDLPTLEAVEAEAEVRQAQEHLLQITQVVMVVQVL
tara:strand:- start:175 stop:372 length:198 start_codon:yes stop_codon:yes gene_type:complete